MNKIIIHPNEYGTITITTPALNCGLSVEQIAQKDVPAGVPYLIIDSSELPLDRTFRNAWQADFSQPDGIGIGAEAWHALNNANNEVL
jgi:hypothetical protein